MRNLSVKLIEDILEQWAETRQLEGKKLHGQFYEKYPEKHM